MLDSVTSLYVIINHHSVTLLVSPAKVQSLLLHLNLHIPPIPALNTATLLQDGAAVGGPVRSLYCGILIPSHVTKRCDNRERQHAQTRLIPPNPMLSRATHAHCPATHRQPLRPRLNHPRRGHPSSLAATGGCCAISSVAQVATCRFPFSRA